MLIRTFCLVFFLGCTACSGLFLYPNKTDYFPKASDHILYEEGFIPSSDGVKLHYWLVFAQKDKKLTRKPKGLVIQVHGNAQNLTAHVRGLGWMTAAGYHVAIFDYRGYGKSSGEPNLAGAYEDVKAALDFITAKLAPKGLPVYFYGQSLGGTLLLKALSSSPGRWHPSAVVIESSFYSYPGIAREKMANSWITWPFQWLAYVAVTGRYSLDDDELKTISPVPVYLYHSENDPIVPFRHGQRIFAGLAEPKEFIHFPEPGHINAMWIRSGELRGQLIEALARARQ